MAFAEMIKEYRQAHSLTQKQFAELFRPSIPMDTVKSWECGRKTPPEWTQGLIAEKLERLNESERMKEDVEINEAGNANNHTGYIRNFWKNPVN